jgi:2-methylisocitrate lyase-like PEP mutase family enzyme
MSELKNKAQAFRALHVPGTPLVLFNIWDPGSAKAATAAGARAIATGSWSVAAANGFSDGEHIPLNLAIDNLTRIVAATVLPVSVDLESGYGKAAAEVGQTIGRAIAAGAVGCNLEDSFPENGKLREVAEQTQRLRHARSAAEAAGIPYFINARTDVFFQKPPQQHDEAMLREAIDRARAYADAGADGIFAPGLVDQALIARLAAALSLPLNIMADAGSPALKALAEVGVARVSHGPGPYLQTMKMLEQIARAAMGAGTGEAARMP